ncbi:MAG: hypothetical protein IPI11_06950 [Haliscomenobacter sp.]|nr:hypothetical protein [Haliscomenobacter sp.]
MTLSLLPENLLLQLQEAAMPLFYISETEKPVRVQRLAGTSGIARFSQSDLLRLLFPGESRLKVEWSGMERPGMKGYQHFFRHYLEKISQTPAGEVIIRMPVEREQAEYWRALHALWMDHFVRQRWFKVHLRDNVSKAVFAVGQHLEIALNPDTNEVTLTPGDWFVLQTGTVET